MITLSEIPTILDQSIRLLSKTERLRRKEETKEAYEYAHKLFPLMQRLTIASMIQDKQIICISGLQGAGKTTLMRNFYHLGDFMNISLGTGEKIPVLITEDNIKEPVLTAKKIVKDEDDVYSAIDVRLESEEFIQATMGKDEHIMYLEITVPYTHTNNKGVSFMLLPGFERNNDYWNDLIEFSVNSSDAAVFVFKPNSFSRVDNEEYLKRIEAKFGANIVYAISETEKSEDNNAEVKRTCLKTLKIKEDEADRVVCFGNYFNREQNEEWIPIFKAALEKYTLNQTQGYKNNKEYIYQILDQLKAILYKINGILDEYETYDIPDMENHQLLKEFDKAVAAKRKELESHITKEFEVAKDESAKKVISLLENTVWYKNLKRMFFGTNIREEYIESQNIIKSSLQKDENMWLPDYYLGKAIECSIRAINDPHKEDENIFKRLMETNEENGKILNSPKNAELIKDMMILLAGPEVTKKSLTSKDGLKPKDDLERKDDDVKIELHCQNIKDVMKAITEVATYYYGFTSYQQLVQHTSGLAHYQPAQPIIKGQDIIDKAEDSKKFAAGLAGVIGIDILGDGSVNLISQLATACGVSLPIAGAAAVIIVAAGGLTVVMRDINRMQRADFEAAKLTINTIYDHILQEALERFDIFTNRVREQIEDNLVALKGSKKQVVDIYNARIYINNLLDMLDKIMDDNLRDSNNVGVYLSNEG